MEGLARPHNMRATTLQHLPRENQGFDGLETAIDSAHMRRYTRL